MPKLVPPTVLENWPTDHPLFSRYKYARGIALLVSGATVTATQYPYQEDFDTHDHVYLGGHEYEITQAEADVLTAAGYGAYITP